MKKELTVISVLALIAGCSDSPNAPGGTLPVVQNCRVVAQESRGDTVAVAWDPVGVEVDGYRVWFASTVPGNWQIIAQVEGTAVTHIATSTGYYSVDAIKGIDSSESTSNRADNRAGMFMLDDTLTVYGTDGIRFTPTHVSIGNASDPSFPQDIFIRWEGDTILFHRGDFDPENYPGGSGSLIASATNTLAPGPGDGAWKNTIAPQEGARYFVALENGDYAMFWVDTVFDTIVVINSSQYQAIPGLRLFNPFIF